MNQKRKSLITGLLVWGLAFCVATPSTAHADTYNFIFSKGKKAKAGATAAEPTDGDSESEAEDKDADRAPEKKAEKKAETVSSDKAPIIIHNNNSIQMPGEKPAEKVVEKAAEAPVKATPTPAKVDTSASNSTEGSFTVSALEDGPSPWRLGLTSTVGTDVGTNRYELMSPVSPLAFGISLAYSFNRMWGWNNFVGFGEYYGSHKMYVGSELEFLPVRWQLSKWDPVAFGFIAGGSTLAAAPGNLATIHGGVRLNINPIKELGITGVLRGNAAYANVEFGLIVRL